MQKIKVHGDSNTIDILKYSDDQQLAIVLENTIRVIDTRNNQNQLISIDDCTFNSNLFNGKDGQIYPQISRQNYFVSADFGPSNSHPYHGCALLVLTSFGECSICLTGSESQYQKLGIINKIYLQTDKDLKYISFNQARWFKTDSDCLFVTSTLSGLILVWRYHPMSCEISLLSQVNIEKNIVNLHPLVFQDVNGESIYCILTTSSDGSTEAFLVDELSFQLNAQKSLFLFKTQFVTQRFFAQKKDMLIVLYPGNLKVFKADLNSGDLQFRQVSSIDLTNNHLISGISILEGDNQLIVAFQNGVLLSFAIEDMFTSLAVDKESTITLHKQINPYGKIEEIQNSFNPIQFVDKLRPRFYGLTKSRNGDIFAAYRSNNPNDLCYIPDFKREMIIQPIKSRNNYESQKNLNTHNQDNIRIEIVDQNCPICHKPLFVVEGNKAQCGPDINDTKFHQWSLCQFTGAILQDPFDIVECAKCQSKSKRFFELKAIQLRKVETNEVNKEVQIKRCKACNSKFKMLF